MSSSDIIRKHWNEIKVRKGDCSLRELAAMAGISPGYLSEVLSEKKTLTESKALLICTNLGFSKRRRHDFILSVRKENAEDESSKLIIEEEMPSLGVSDSKIDLQDEELRKISGYLYNAIIYMVKGKKRAMSTKNIAHELQIPESEVQSVLDNLKSVGLVFQAGDLYYADERKYIHSCDNASIETRKAINRELLTLGRQAFENLPVESRQVISNIIVVPTDRVKEVRKRIASFHLELLALVENFRDHNEMDAGLNAMCFFTQLFPPIKARMQKGES